MIVGLNNSIISMDERKDKVEQLAEYLRIRIRSGVEHRSWAFKFFLCECLNLVNVVGQIFLTDAFLGGEFTQYGIEVGEIMVAIMTMVTLAFSH